ncbi:MAG TPA: glycosyltransferase family 4 protein [Pyrinomonadaceae bacterium]
MHVVFVDTTLTTFPTGGAQTFLVQLAQSLVQKNWRVSIVTQPGPEMSLVNALLQAGAEVRSGLWREVHLPEERGARLAEWVNSEDPDVYVVSISPDAGWLALPYLNPSISTVSIAHNDVEAFYAPVTHYAPLIDRAVGVSEEIHRKISSASGVPADRAQHIPYGVPSLSAEEMAQRLEQSRDGLLRVGYVGRLTHEQKRVMEFVPLAQTLIQHDVRFELHLIGDGDDRLRLEEAFKQYAPEAPVKFWGWLSPAEVSNRLRQLDVFILMSDYEGLPVALLEAMGHGLAPVVSGIASGNTQLVHDGRNGFIVETGNVSAFAERLQMLANDQKLLSTMKSAAWEKGREYSAKRMVDRYLACFDGLISNRDARDRRKGLVQPYPVMKSCQSPYPVWLRKVKSHLKASLATTRTLLLALGGGIR